MRMRTELRLLVAAVIVMVLGAVATLGVFWRASSLLATAHQEISDNAAPTVVALDVAQARVRKLDGLVRERLMGAPGDQAIRDASIVAAKKDLVHAINDYLILPFDPGEKPLLYAVTGSLAHVERVVDRTLAVEPGMGDASGFRSEVDKAMAQLSLDLVQASEFSANLAKVSADDMQRRSTWTLRVGAAIEALTFAAVIVTLVLIYRAVQRARALEARSLAALEHRADELENFSGRVAHDLLSPLMTVSLALDLASGRLTEPEDAVARNAIMRAARTLKRIRDFVSDLLEFARAGANPPPGARAQIDDVVHEIADEFGPVARDAGVELRIETTAMGRVVACSPGALMSVLSNLVQNAIKYMGNGEVRQIAIRYVANDNEVRVEVQDTGPGIAPSERERLFDLYARGNEVKASGLGLGLATVKRLVESHGGHVGVETELGRGSVFWFSMPAAA
jgi:signal transduction histidine kinase